MTNTPWNKITLHPYMRALLLKEICRHMDIIDYCKYLLNFTLTPNIQNIYTGDCPLCIGYKSFVINDKTGKYFCIGCREEGDFFTFLRKMEGRNLNTILNMLIGYIEVTEKRKAVYAGGAV